jgi:hypothetical protein
VRYTPLSAQNTQETALSVHLLPCGKRMHALKVGRESTRMLSLAVNPTIEAPRYHNVATRAATFLFLQRAERTRAVVHNLVYSRGVVRARQHDIIFSQNDARGSRQARRAICRHIRVDIVLARSAGSPGRQRAQIVRAWMGQRRKSGNDFSGSLISRC